MRMTAPQLKLQQTNEMKTKQFNICAFINYWLISLHSVRLDKIVITENKI